MNRKKPLAQVDEMRKEYDFSEGVRGKYHERFKQGSVIAVVLEPDVAAVFKDSASVNQALRILVSVAKASVPAK